ncbi:MAG TPA: phosphate regulon sensor histidine kinase PhoR [Gammaproteobacteria bacterium]|nr:phosphate regulon sensor histidine kinase PhoR [Gammaproteobacteria bacterium]
MTRRWLQEILYLGLLLIVALIVGWFIGHVGRWLSIAVTIYLAWHISNLYRLERWLRYSRRFDVPSTFGIWDDIFNDFYQLKLRERERKWRLVQLLREIRDSTAAMPDGMVILDRVGEIRWMNEAAGRLLHLRVRQDVGQRLVNLMRHPDFVPYLNGSRYDEPISLASPFSRSVYLSMSIVPYGSEQRLLLVRDTSRLHRLEAIRAEFVANASHELRSPLTVMHGYLDAMREDERLRKTWGKPLDEMHHQTLRMTAIVSDLLELSRLETEQRQAPYSPVNVAKLVLGIRDEALSLGQGPTNIIMKVDAGLFLLGAEHEIYSAFSNLVFNAMKYTPEDGSVTITWARENGDACFTVADTGIGIPAAHIPRLTERFYRVDVSRHRDSGGTGLGLAIVKHVMQHHGAILVIDSEPGRGSRFSCRFPPERVSCAIDKVVTA